MAIEVILLLTILQGCSSGIPPEVSAGAVATPPVITDCSEAEAKFGWEDYLVVVAMLVGSCSIGLFYCLFDKSQVTSSDFLTGGGTMGTFPMAMSLASGFVTAIELLGNPAEMYTYGTQFWMTCISFILVVPITTNIFLPVFMKLQLTSSYEYLELRFGSYARIIGSALYIIQMMLYTSVAVYAPALALSHVTGLNVYLAVTVIYLVCVFYASQGGMKAVIMTDSFQASVLIGSLICVLCLGDQLQGGSIKIIDDSLHSDRLEIFNMDPRPTVRHSFWSVVIGGTFYWATMFCSNQATVQKYLSVKTIKQARTAIWVSSFALILIYSINFYTGMIMYSAFKKCDPVTAGEVTGSDELLPLYVMLALAKFKGVPGFFVAGIFCASLGTVAAALNSLAAVSIQDFITGIWRIEIPDEKGAALAKWVSLVFGVASFLLIFLVEQLGNVLTIALSFNGMIGGVTLGLFALGMLVPWANNKGALAGSITALALVMWIGLGAQVAQLEFEGKPVSIEECHCLNITSVPPPFEHKEVFSLYEISYLWYSAIGALVTVIVGTIVSFLTEPLDPYEVDSDLLAPPIVKYLRKGFVGSENKEQINMPQRVKVNKIIPNNFASGIQNLALELNDEKLSAGSSRIITM